MDTLIYTVGWMGLRLLSGSREELCNLTLFKLIISLIVIFHTLLINNQSHYISTSAPPPYTAFDYGLVFPGSS